MALFPRLDTKRLLNRSPTSTTPGNCSSGLPQNQILLESCTQFLDHIVVTFSKKKKKGFADGITVPMVKDFTAAAEPQTNGRICPINEPNFLENLSFIYSKKNWERVSPFNWGATSPLRWDSNSSLREQVLSKMLFLRDQQMSSPSGKNWDEAKFSSSTF